MKQVKVVVMTSGHVFISELEEVGADIGQPDCKLVKPHLLDGELNLHKFMREVTDQEDFMVSSDKILTILDAKEDIVKKYEEAIK